MSQATGEFLKGETIPIYAEFKSSGVLVNPASVKIYVTLLGTTATYPATNVSMTNASTGLYYYNLALTSVGNYQVVIVYTDALGGKRTKETVIRSVQPAQVIQ